MSRETIDVHASDRQSVSEPEALILALILESTSRVEFLLHYPRLFDRLAALQRSQPDDVEPLWRLRALLEEVTDRLRAVADRERRLFDGNNQPS